MGSSPTGQISRQAPQVVQAHAASGLRAKVSRGESLRPLVLSSMRLLISSAEGLSDLPVWVAGQTSWQRLHWMQA